MPINSAVVIARLLSTEGFTDHVASEVRRYALRQATKDQRKRYKRRKQAFAAMLRCKLDPAEKLLLGKVISALCKMHFDTGLRIGLTAHAHEHSKPVELNQEEEE